MVSLYSLHAKLSHNADTATLGVTLSRLHVQSEDAYSPIEEVLMYYKRLCAPGRAREASVELQAEFHLRVQDEIKARTTYFFHNGFALASERTSFTLLEVLQTVEAGINEHHARRYRAEERQRRLGLYYIDRAVLPVDFSTSEPEYSTALEFTFNNAVPDINSECVKEFRDWVFERVGWRPSKRFCEKMNNDNPDDFSIPYSSPVRKI